MSHSVNLCAIFVTVLFFSAVRCSDKSCLPNLPEDQGTFTMFGGSDAAFCAAGHEDRSLGWAPKPSACLLRHQHGYEEIFARSNQAMLAMLGCVFKRPPSGAGDGDGALPCGAAQGSQLGDEFATQSSGATLPSLGDRNDKGKSDAIPSHAHPASEGPFGPPQPKTMTLKEYVLAEQQKNINELLSRKRKAVKQSVEESSMVGNTLHSEAVDKSVEISPVVHTLHSEGEEIIFQWSPILE